MTLQCVKWDNDCLQAAVKVYTLVKDSDYVLSLKGLQLGKLCTS